MPVCNGQGNEIIRMTFVDNMTIPVLTFQSLWSSSTERRPNWPSSRSTLPFRQSTSKSTCHGQSKGPIPLCALRQIVRQTQRSTASSWRSVILLGKAHGGSSTTHLRPVKSQRSPSSPGSKPSHSPPDQPGVELQRDGLVDDEGEPQLENHSMSEQPPAVAPQRAGRKVTIEEIEDEDEHMGDEHVCCQYIQLGLPRLTFTYLSSRQICGACAIRCSRSPTQIQARVRRYGGRAAMGSLHRAPRVFSRTRTYSR